MKQRLTVALMAGAAILALPTLAAGFTLSRPEIKAGAMMPRSFEFNGVGRSGENKSPALQWRDAPKGTWSFAVTVYDPHAPPHQADGSGRSSTCQLRSAN